MNKREIKRIAKLAHDGIDVDLCRAMIVKLSCSYITQDEASTVISNLDRFNEAYRESFPKFDLHETEALDQALMKEEYEDDHS